MKIATILPYKENYTYSKAQAAAIWVCDFFKYSKYKLKVWENSTLSNRIISWILNIDIIINNGTFEFKKNFFQNIILQCNHLKKNIKFEKNPIKKIEALSALILSGIIFKYKSLKKSLTLSVESNKALSS